MRKDRISPHAVVAKDIFQLRPDWIMPLRVFGVGSRAKGHRECFTNHWLLRKRASWQRREITSSSHNQVVGMAADFKADLAPLAVPHVILRIVRDYVPLVNVVEYMRVETVGLVRLFEVISPAA